MKIRIYFSVTCLWLATMGVTYGQGGGAPHAAQQVPSENNEWDQWRREEWKAYLRTIIAANNMEALRAVTAQHANKIEMVEAASAIILDTQTAISQEMKDLLQTVADTEDSLFLDAEEPQEPETSTATVPPLIAKDIQTAAKEEHKGAIQQHPHHNHVTDHTSAQPSSSNKDVNALRKRLIAAMERGDKDMVRRLAGMASTDDKTNAAMQKTLSEGISLHLSPEMKSIVQRSLEDYKKRVDIASSRHAPPEPSSENSALMYNMTAHDAEKSAQKNPVETEISLGGRGQDTTPQSAATPNAQGENLNSAHHKQTVVMAQKTQPQVQNFALTLLNTAQSAANASLKRMTPMTTAPLSQPQASLGSLQNIQGSSVTQPSLGEGASKKDETLGHQDNRNKGAETQSVNDALLLQPSSLKVSQTLPPPSIAGLMHTSQRTGRRAHAMDRTRGKKSKRGRGGHQRNLRGQKRR